HINSLETNSTISGIETYYQTEQSKELASKLHESLVGKLGVPDRAIRKARFYVINHTSVPAVLAEVGFISNRQEREKLISSDYQWQVANALAHGVILYLANESPIAQSSGKSVKAAVNSQSTHKKTNEGLGTKITSLAEASVTVEHQARPTEQKKQESSPL
ncbi:MAG: N-acetylmuramoyl-L-alanine amidase, partial [Candidatus Melainabacteria bacterium]|nr:N-acetylmuramoyl-L-alanine amidase [Candidatus Melainabacteria bacterium]